MIELIKIVGVGLVTAIAAVLLRSTKPELSFAVTVAGIVIILIFAIDLVGETFGIFAEIGEMSGIDSSLIKIIVKIIAIGYLVEFAAGIVEDFGSKSIADKLVFAGKVVIFTVSVPIIRSMVALIGGFLEMI
ncbi:MAG TPA: stage III sporulation AC/AD family protein [Candidatus Borkfalkia excrementigallinarum]|mgnify:FL=1|uniref:Stage III sporulation AC/AD family protein n=1 Tax=Candidatus Borkfalkia excrementigallinarum TaxID=2838506 RepID=A0A9D1ZWM6_9FIRM|nr:stage III sporulation AC/AD family protein [Candidatus Borkfalkia excrementigallinarum]